jgi:hypothetical protein
VTRRTDIAFWAVVAAVEIGLIVGGSVTAAVVLPSIALAGYLAVRGGSRSRG